MTYDDREHCVTCKCYEPTIVLNADGSMEFRNGATMPLCDTCEGPLLGPGQPDILTVSGESFHDQRGCRP